MKRIFLLAALLAVSVLLNAQSMEFGQIGITAYVPEDCGLPARVAQVLDNKLKQIVAAGGVSGSSFDNRFVLTANIRPLQTELTGGAPAKMVVTLDVSLFVGDGLTGTLFNSVSNEVKGIGENETQAYMSAIRKINPRSGQNLALVNEAKKRIVSYYEAQLPNIISQAQAAARNGNYDQAIAILGVVPSVCSGYAQVQTLIGDYGAHVLQANNQQIIDKAKGVWSSGENCSGADGVAAILSEVYDPTPQQQAQINTLYKSMENCLSAKATREYQAEQARLKREDSMERTRMQSAERVEKARLNAAARTAEAYYKSRPRVTYHVHTWW